MHFLKSGGSSVHMENNDFNSTGLKQSSLSLSCVSNKRDKKCSPLWDSSMVQYLSTFKLQNKYGINIIKWIGLYICGILRMKITVCKI